MQQPTHTHRAFEKKSCFCFFEFRDYYLRSGWRKCDFVAGGTPLLLLLLLLLLNRLDLLFCYCCFAAEKQIAGRTIKKHCWVCIYILHDMTKMS